MEALYSKLYDKYTKLKTKKENEMEELNRDQEMKFLTYMSAADDLIEHLRSENVKLSAEVSKLRSEVASIRIDKDQQDIEHQKLLLEENQKYKELSEEIERLRNKECHSSFRDEEFENGQQNMFESFPVTVDGTSKSSSRKRSRDLRQENEGSVTLTSISAPPEHAPIGGSITNFQKQPISTSDTFSYNKAKCCRRRVDSSGIEDASAFPSCMFQDLVECLVDLKFSITSQTDEIFLSALHESSGYSFSLRWMDNSVGGGGGGGDTELLYRATSLGTFERVAPEWMREVLLFSKRMCPIFFKRVSYVVKLHK